MISQYFTRAFCFGKAFADGAKNHLCDHRGDSESTSKVTWMAIVVVIAVLCLGALTLANTSFRTWLTATFSSWFPSSGTVKPTT